MATTQFVSRPPVLIVRPLGRQAGDRPHSLWFSINSWVLSWLLGSVVLAAGAMLWDARPVTTPPQALHAPAQSPTYDAERCAGVSLTWNAAALAADQFRRTGQPEYQADAEALRNQARREGLLYCTGDPQDR